MSGSIATYLEYPFVRYALIVGMLIALCSSLFGVTLVLKRFSFIGDGLSHVAFGAMAVASVVNLTNQMILVLPITVGCAILMLRFGYLIMNLFSTSTNLSGDVCTTLFGSTSILTLTEQDVLLSAILSLAVVAVFIIFYNKIFAVTFDESFSKATGTNAGAYNLLIAVVISVVIVVAMQLVGSLLISALVVFPALSAMRIFGSFKKVTVFSAVLSVSCAFAGMIISMAAGTPVGATIVMVDIAAFFICFIIGVVGRR